MRRSIAVRCASATLLAVPLLPICGVAVSCEPAVVFLMGTIGFFIGVGMVCVLIALGINPPESSSPVASRFRFTLRDLFCLATVAAGIVVFMGAGFKCEAAEKASRPNPLPAATERRFIWEMESGLVLATIGSLIWLRRFGAQSKHLNFKTLTR